MSNETETLDAGPQVAPFREAATASAAASPLGNDERVEVFTQIACYVTKIANVVPGIGTHAATRERAMLWCDDEGGTYAAMRYNARPLLEINEHIAPLIRFALLGYCMDIKLNCAPLSIVGEGGGEMDTEDGTHLVAFATKDGQIQVPPDLEDSKDEIQAATDELTRVLNAARKKARDKSETESGSE